MEARLKSLEETISAMMVSGGESSIREMGT
jgi:hypothetical protein